MNENRKNPSTQKTGHKDLTDLENKYWKHMFTAKEAGENFGDAQKSFDLGVPSRFREAQDFIEMEDAARFIEKTQNPEKTYKTIDNKAFITETDLYDLMTEASDREELRYFLNQFQMSDVRRNSYLNSLHPSDYDTKDLLKDAATGKLMSVSDPKFYMDFAKTAKDTVLGLRHLPGVGWNVGKEILKDGDFVQEFFEAKNLDQWDQYIKKYPTISGMMSDIYMRMGSPERIKQTFDENQWSIPTDVMSGGAGIAKLGKYGRIARALEMVNPGDLPLELSSIAAKRGLEGLSQLRKKSNEAKIDPTMQMRIGQNPDGTPITHEKPVNEMIEDLGMETTDVPPSVRTDSKPIQTQEALYRKTEDSDIKNQLENMDATTEGAIEAYQRDLANDQGISDAFDTETVGNRFYEDFNEHRKQVEQEISDEYNQATNEILNQNIQFAENTTESIPITRQFIENRKTSKNVNEKDLQQIENILDSILEDQQPTTLQDIKDIRTEYRRRINNQFRTGEISEIGSGTLEAQVYSQLTNDLHSQIESVSGKKSLDRVKEIDKKYATLSENQRNTPAGRLLFDPANMRDPARLVDKLIDAKLGQKDMELFYDMVGENAKVGMRAAITAKIFNRSMRGTEWTPKGLSNELARIGGGKKGQKNYLKSLLGDDPIAESLTLKIYEVAEFSKRMDRVKRITDGSQTAYLLHTMGSIGGALSMNASDAFYMWGMGGDIVEIGIGMVAGNIGTKLMQRGLDWTRKALGDKKFQALLDDQNGVEMFLQGLPSQTAEAASKLISWHQSNLRIVQAAAKSTAREKEREKRKKAAASQRIPNTTIYERLMEE